MQGLLKIALHEAALGAVDGRAADAEALGNGLVRHPGIGREQDLRALERAGRTPATPEQGLEVGALGVAQIDPVTYVHRASPLREAPMNRSCGDVLDKVHRHARSVPGLTWAFRSQVHDYGIMVLPSVALRDPRSKPFA